MRSYWSASNGCVQGYALAGTETVGKSPVRRPARWARHAALHQQIEDHRNFRDCRGDGHEHIDRLANVGDQKNKQQATKVQSAAQNEEDAQRPWKDR